VFLISIASAASEVPVEPTSPEAAFTANIAYGNAPLKVTFTDIGTGGVPTSWYWDFGDGIDSEHAQTATHTFNDPGTYTVTLTVNNDAGSDTATKTDYITVTSESEASETSEGVEASEVPAKPTATFTADVTTGYAPLSVHFTSETTGNPISYFWVFEPETNNDWNSNHPVTAVHTFKNPGVYTVNLVVSNSAGSSTMTETNYITVLAKPTQKPTAAFTADVKRGKVPLGVKFADTSTGGVPTSWYWDFGDGTTSEDAQTAVHTFTKPGIYTVTLTVTNDGGSDTVSKANYITASAASEMPIASFYSLQAEKEVTRGESLDVPATVSFRDSSTGSPASWFWDFGDGETSTVKNPTHKYVEAGSYTVTLTVTNDAGSNKVSKDAYVLAVAKEQPENIPTAPPENKETGQNADISTLSEENRKTSSSASFSLHGEKTDVVCGEDILLKLSAVNFITKPIMHVQVIIIPPSGMSVSSSEFVQSGAGQYTTTYDLDPGQGKDIEIRIESNQPGNLNVEGKVIYYFGEDIKGAEDYKLDLPIKVEPKSDPQLISNPASYPIPGLGVASLVFILMTVFIFKRKQK
jgi:PKD repeat protein